MKVFLGGKYYNSLADVAQYPNSQQEKQNG